MSPMSDREAWITFAATAYTGWLANGDHTNEKCREYACDDADALLAELNKRHPLPSPAEPTPPQFDDDGWIKWDGGECPVAPNTRVQVRCRNGWEDTAARGGIAAGYLNSPAADPMSRSVNGNWWLNRGTEDDIVAYRIVSQAGVTK